MGWYQSLENIEQLPEEELNLIIEKFRVFGYRIHATVGGYVLAYNYKTITYKICPYTELHYIKIQVIDVCFSHFKNLLEDVDKGC